MSIDHKHCIFCGRSSDSKEVVCDSQLNPLQPDTVGNKPHAYPISIKERAKQAADRARNTDPSEIEFFSAE